MSTTQFDGDSIGPELDLAAFRLPPHVGARLAATYDRDGRFDTAAEWIAAIRETSEQNREQVPTRADLCHMADGPHSVEVDGETESFVCVLDPLVVPFLDGRPATVTSTTPEDGATVTIDVGADGATADPGDAVISIGASRGVDADGPPSMERVYQETCPYIHAFASLEEYEEWAAGVDAATTTVSVETGVALARELADGLFGE